MADNYEEATVDPRLPAGCVTQVDLWVLGQSGFKAYLYPDDDAYYFCVEDGIREDARDWPDQDVPGGLAAQDAYDHEVLEAARDGGMGYTYADIFQRIIRKAGIPELVIEGCYRCSKLRAGEFGGFVTRVTPGRVQWGGTQQMLRIMRKEAGDA